MTYRKSDHDGTEEVLKRALRRQSAPAGFADRVLARTAEADAADRRPTIGRPRLRLFSWPVLRWASAATLAAALVSGGVYRRHLEDVKAARERAEGEAAKQQLVLALRIAGSKLQLAKSKVTRINEVQGTKRIKE